MKGVIDRFEEAFAVIVTEDEDIINVQKDKVPDDAAEGDVVNIEGSVITIDREETKKRNSKKDFELWED